MKTKRATSTRRASWRRLTALTLFVALMMVAPVLGQSEGKGVVNVNTASLDELQLLPRVGPSVAQRILDFRENNGAFRRVEDLLLVRGIGEKTFELMSPYLTLEGPTTLTSKVRPPRAGASQLA